MTPIRNTHEQWGSIQRTFHWGIVLLVLIQLIFGFVIYSVGGKGAPEVARFWHPSLGITIGALMLLRLGWRLANPIPETPRDIVPSMQGISKFTHYGLYALLILQPLVGYVLVSAFGHSPEWFGVAMPPIVGKSPHIAHVFGYMHGAIAFLILGFLALHIMGALQHELVLRDNVLPRMLPGLAMTPERQARQEGDTVDLRNAVRTWVRRDNVTPSKRAG